MTNRLPLAAAITLAVMGAAAMLLWRHSAAVSYVWYNVVLSGAALAIAPVSRLLERCRPADVADLVIAVIVGSV